MRLLVNLIAACRHPWDSKERKRFRAARIHRSYHSALSSDYRSIGSDRIRPKAATRQSDYELWIENNRLTPTDIGELRAALAERGSKLPRISLITPVYNTAPEWMIALVESVQAQIYEDWELCVADDCSPASHVRPMLDELRARDHRIKVVSLSTNGGISNATNAAVTIATGEVIAFLDHDDLITPDCLAELAIYYADHAEADIVYSDDDKIGPEHYRYAPQFKPGWSPALLLSFMYLGHILSVRRALFIELGGFRSEYDGSQDHDFFLRASERAREIGHIPKVLYHWRAVEGSTAVSGDAKPMSIEAGRLAVADALSRRGVQGNVVHPDWAMAGRVGMFEIEFPDCGPTVSIVIPTKNRLKLLRACVGSIAKTSYRDYEIVIIDNDSDDSETLAYLAELQEQQSIRVVKIGNPAGRFSFAALNNAAVRQVTSDYVLFLNNDTEVLSPGWLSQMMGYAQMSGVGAVGARLYYEDGTIQHAGIVHGYHDGLVGHAFRNLPQQDWGYLGFIRAAREYSAVTAACMLTRRAVFTAMGGFDEVKFAVAYNDVDYCYRLVLAGLTCVYCPSAELIHYEGKSRGFQDDPEEKSNFRRKYGNWNDRWYSRNLSLEDESFRIASARPETKRKAPIRILAVSHNLNREGAPIVLFDLIVGLVERGIVRATVLSPVEGPLRSNYEAAGIPVVIAGEALRGVSNQATLDVALYGLGRLFAALGAEVVLANTLQTFWAAAASAQHGIPTIWYQHESEPWQTYFNDLPKLTRSAAYAAFAKAYRVVYVANATKRAWSALETRRNFQVIRHGIPQARLLDELSRWSRTAARERLNLSNSDVAIIVVGTICERKGQLDAIRAYVQLSDSLKQRVRIYLVGALVAPYSDAVSIEISALTAHSGRISMVGAVDDPYLYYAAADIMLCCSRIESAPRTIIEAMAFDLPIITTPVFGIPEMVVEDVNALFYEPGDVRELCALLERLVEDEKLHARLRLNSKAVLDSQPTFEDMILSFESLLRQAVNLDSRDRRSSLN
ncbi:glycosyltransferase [Kaistia terrae]|uniref:Glycosyltransferase n=1 Tax=Kaistia terrae TaxID=537017 RepID=A0ABW0PZX7_9HYPH|nr:glycosyltransferase [Kaistia terrae]MCX5577042.1 glycosyltransferase [Kaistia terrae]